jgi:hypothetical protein
VRHLHSTVYIRDPDFSRGLIRKANLAHHIQGLVEKARGVVRILNCFFKLR